MNHCPIFPILLFFCKCPTTIFRLPRPDHNSLPGRPHIAHQKLTAFTRHRRHRGAHQTPTKVPDYHPRRGGGDCFRNTYRSRVKFFFTPVFARSWGLTRKHFTRRYFCLSDFSPGITRHRLDPPGPDARWEPLCQGSILLRKGTDPSDAARSCRICRVDERHIKNLFHRFL